MKRRLFKLALFLILGAIVNVAVAWGLIIWSPRAEQINNINVTQWPLSLSIPERLALPILGYIRSGIGWEKVSLIYEISKDNSPVRYEIYRRTYWSAGIPAHSMRAEKRSGFTPPAGTGLEWHWVWHIPTQFNWLHAQRNRPLPLRPIWSGFAFNTVFYTTLLWLLTLVPFTARRMIRCKRGHCIKCGYDLRETPDKCPECGWGREAEA